MNLAAAASVVFSVSAVGISLVSMGRQARYEARLTSLSAMVPYTEKYERIMAQLTDAERTKGLWGLAPSDAMQARTLKVFLQYCNLCSEEFHLAKGVLDPELWRIWRHEMQGTFQSPFGRAAWSEAKKAGHFVSHGEFERQVDEWVGSVGSVSPIPAKDQLVIPTVDAP